MIKHKKIKRKGWLWALVLVTVIILILGLWQKSLLLNYGKKGGSRPHVSVKKIVVHDISEDRISMTAQMMVSNPLLIDLKAERLQYQVLIDSVKVLETEFVKPVSIRPLDSVIIDLPIVLLTRPLAALLNDFETHGVDSANYTLNSKLYFDLPLVGEKTYTVNRTRRGPAYRLIKLRIEDVDIEKFRLKDSDLSMSLIVENPNIFPISMRDVDYDLIIGKDFHMEGQVKDITHLPARSNIRLPLELDVHTKNIPRLVWQVLFEKKHTPYRLTFKCKMVTDDATFKDTRFIVAQDGRLDELKELKETLPGGKDKE